MIIKIKISLFPDSSNNHFFKYLFFIAAGLILSFRKNLPAINASIAPIVVATEHTIVPSTGPKRSPAAMANVIPGNASTTQPTIVSPT